MKLFRTCAAWTVAVTVLLSVAPGVHAQLRPPSGWKSAQRQGGTVYTSPTINKDMGIIVLSAPEKWQGGSLTDFLRSQLRGRNGNSDPALNRNLAVRTLNARTALAMTGTTTNGIKMVVLMSAHARPDGRVQRLTAMWADNREGAANVKPVATDMVRQLMNANSGGASVTKRAPVTRGKSTTRTVRRNNSTRPTNVAPAGGPIHSVSLVGTYESGVGGTVYYVFNPYIFYKNGLVVRDFQAPPAEINVPAFSRENPYDWGKWRRSGENTLILWNGDRDGKPDTVKTKDIQPAIRGSRGMRLNGKYDSLSGGGDTAFGGSTVVFSSKTLIFNPNGRFATRSAGGGGNNAVTALSQSPTESGTYSIDGYAITLKFGNGKVVRKAFIIYGNGRKSKVDNSVVHVGGNTYVKDKD